MRDSPHPLGARFRVYFYVSSTGRYVRLNVSPGTSGNTYAHLGRLPPPLTPGYQKMP